MTDAAPRSPVPSISASPGAAAATGRTTFTPTLEDLIAVYRLHHRASTLESRSLAGLAVVVVVLTALGYAATDSVAAPICIAACALAIPFAIDKWLIPVRAGRIFDQQRLLHEEYVVEWDEAGLRAITKNSDNFAPWTHYRRWRENQAVIIGYHSDVMFQYVPKRALTEDQIASLRSHAKAAGVEGQ